MEMNSRLAEGLRVVLTAEIAVGTMKWRCCPPHCPSSQFQRRCLGSDSLLQQALSLLSDLHFKTTFIKLFNLDKIALPIKYNTLSSLIFSQKRNKAILKLFPPKKNLQKAHLFRDPHIPYIIKRELNSKLYS
jgi:hypothetical protein